MFDDFTWGTKSTSRKKKPKKRRAKRGAKSAAAMVVQPQCGGESVIKASVAGKEVPFKEKRSPDTLVSKRTSYAPYNGQLLFQELTYLVRI